MPAAPAARRGEEDDVPMVEVELGGGDGRGQGGDFSSTGGAETKGSASNIFNNKNVLTAIAGGVVLLILWTLVGYSTSEASGSERSSAAAPPLPRPTLMKVGATASTHHLAAEAGMAAMKAGGNAADAAAAMQFVLNVVQPTSTGIGGGLFAVIYNASTGKAYTIDAREEAPSAAHPDIFCKDTECWDKPCSCASGEYMTSREARYGGLSVGVPGIPRGIEKLLRDHGTGSVKDALAPAIRIARDGFPMYEWLHDKIKKLIAEPGILELPALGELWKLFLNDDKDDSRYQVGEIMKNPDLAATFELMAEKGIDEFYSGQLAQEIVDAAQKAKVGMTERAGVLSLEDMKGYKAVNRKHVNTTYRGSTIIGMGSPSSGGIAIAQMLNLLEGVELTSMKHNGLDHLTHLLQAHNLAWADRNHYVGDADFVEMPVGWLNDEECAASASGSDGVCDPGCIEVGDFCEAKGLLSKRYARERRGWYMRTPWETSPLPSGKFDGIDFAASPHQEEKGTSHLMAADADGNIVSLTTTIEGNWGSGVVVPGRGFILNNEMTDFSKKPRGEDGLPIANAISGERRRRRTALGEDSETVGGKRPRSSMSPTIVIGADGKQVFGIGCSGGSYIIGSVLGGIVNSLDFGMGMQGAINASRAWGFNNGQVRLEDDSYCFCNGRDLFADAALKAGLLARGLVEATSGFRLVASTTRQYLQAIGLGSDGKVTAAADVQRAHMAGAFVE